MILCGNPAEQFRSWQSEIEEAVLRVMRSNRFVLGPEVEALEAEFAAYIGVQSAIGVANGTDALELALRALDIGPGDEVITVSHTAVATVAAVEAAGANPVLVDVEPDCCTLDPAQLDEAVSTRTKAVIAVHLYGQAANLDAIAAFCNSHGLALIEDASQAHGGTWRGERLGAIGQIGCFSCYPTKNLGAIGDAGLVTTNDPQLAKKIKMLREYGWERRNISEFAGRNSRIDELQAAILRVKLRHLDEDNEKRRRIAGYYYSGLQDLPLRLPRQREYAECVYHLYVVQLRNRADLCEHLQKHEIYPGIHYPMPIHLQPAYKNRVRHALSMHVTDRLADEVLSLPIYPELKAHQVDDVVGAIRTFFNE